jgi:hypothetical protein
VGGVGGGGDTGMWVRNGPKGYVYMRW